RVTVKKKKTIHKYKKNKNLNTFWPRFVKKDYLFAKFYKKNFFFNIFGHFHLYSKKKKKIPMVNKYHQNKVLSVSKKC
ncbi:unnamed protein product, partial [Staurois parvus]